MLIGSFLTGMVSDAWGRKKYMFINYAIMSQLPGVGVELPAAIFGVFALIAGIVMYWIPETLFAPMHQTIEEAEAAEDDYSIPFCGKPLTPRHEKALLRDTGNHVGKDEGIEITL
ncbi:hypothetical protein QZH41_015908 [Actinostola sp. cb2023]|nr:hypothetical protein QZH41_015908 [Actinostola sp. cb2023]